MRFSRRQRTNLRLGREHLLAQWQQDATAAAGEESEMPDADESRRQDMQQEPAQELLSLKGEEPRLVFMSGVAPSERDLVTIEGNETAIGYSDTMGVGAEIPQHLVRPTEWRLAGHHPAHTIELTDQAPKEPGLNQSANETMKDQFSGSINFLERLEKFAAEDLAENAFWEKEARVARVFPLVVIRRQTARGDHTVNMRMMLELLIPGMQDAEESRRRDAWDQRRSP